MARPFIVRVTIALAGEVSRIDGIAARLDPPGMLRSSTSTVGLCARERAQRPADVAGPADDRNPFLSREQHPQAATHNRMAVGEHNRRTAPLSPGRSPMAVTLASGAVDSRGDQKTPAMPRTAQRSSHRQRAPRDRPPAIGADHTRALETIVTASG